MSKLFVNLAALVALPLAGHAVETQTWEHATRADFEKGTLEGLSLRSDGRLMLAPRTAELLDASVAYLWAVAEDAKGNLWVGGGGPGAAKAKLFRINPAGESQEVAELEGLQIQALAVDGDNVYAGTSPDGKVHRISSSGEVEVYYDPKAKYIWA
ncbi:MAG: hypothetical protein GY953_58070, partial [bacterium]|nr:hypothetical protein [bacterium]